MAKRENIVRELINYLQGMTDADKVAMYQFVSKYRSSNALVEMLKALEKTETDGSLKGMAQMIVHDNAGKYYKNFHRLKKRLLEYELSSKRLDLFKNSDPHRYYFMALKKEILAAELMTEHNAYYNSIQLLKDVLQRARQFEYSELVENCLRDMIQFAQFAGIQDADLLENHEASMVLNRAYQAVHRQFEEMSFGWKCCPEHSLIGRHSLPISTEKSLQGLKKVDWMYDYEHALQIFEDGLYRQAYGLVNALKRRINSDPGLYPASFRLCAYLLMLECLSHLGRDHSIERFGDKLLRIDAFPAYQRIPVLHFFLHHFLRTGDKARFFLLQDEIRRDMAYDHFPVIRGHARALQCAYFFAAGRLSEMLSLLNRAEGKEKISCIFLQFNLRCMEILALDYLKEDLLVLDKMESCRRFFQRHIDLHEKQESYHIYTSLRKFISGVQSPLLYGDSPIQGHHYDTSWIISRYLEMAALRPDRRPFPLWHKAEYQSNSSGISTDLKGWKQKMA